MSGSLKVRKTERMDMVLSSGLPDFPAFRLSPQVSN
jgi:hypothetical protein